MVGEIEAAARLEMWRDARCQLDRVYWDLISFSDPKFATTRRPTEAWANEAIRILQPVKAAIETMCWPAGQGDPAPLLDALARVLDERAKVRANFQAEDGGSTA